MLLQAAAAAAAAGGPAPAPMKSVVFSQFIGMLDLVGAALTAEGIPFVRIDGKTSAANRQAAIRAFAGKAEPWDWAGACVLEGGGTVAEVVGKASTAYRQAAIRAFAGAAHQMLLCTAAALQHGYCVSTDSLQPCNSILCPQTLTTPAC